MLLGTMMIFAASQSSAQTQLLHYWHFNNTLPATGAGGIHFGTSPMNSDFSRTSVSASGYLRYVKHPLCVKDTGYWDNNVGDTINERMSFGGCCPSPTATTANCSIRTRNPSDSMMFLWYIPTTNHKNIKIAFETMASSTSSGQHRMNYEYSLDSGATYITSSLPRLYDSAGTAWGRVTLDLSAITAVNNNHKLMLRIKFSAPNTGSSGNNRYDNITVEGDSIAATPTGISEIKNQSSTFHLYPNPSKGVVTLSSKSSEPVSIAVISLLGQRVFATEGKENDEVTMDLSALHTGLYYIAVTGTESKKTEMLKLIKN